MLITRVCERCHISKHMTEYQKIDHINRKLICHICSAYIVDMLKRNVKYTIRTLTGVQTTIPMFFKSDTIK